MGKLEKSLILDSYVRRRKTPEISEKNKKREKYRKVSIVLRKCESNRSQEEIELLKSSLDIVKQVLIRKDRQKQNKERVLEKEDPYETIDKKAQKLASVLSRARHLVCYTGAGISTSAKIPDYRGSQGIWTLLQKGQSIGEHDLTLAEPTYTHMALFELHRRNILQYVLSQNCDGLHLRSGLPRASLSEIHGNMYVEVCKNCKNHLEYWRLFDTTEQTARYYHKTNRRCHLCGHPLVDTIVHFGERGSLKWPLNWAGACHHAEKADVILCLGSSLKVLKKYSWLWAMDRPKHKRPKIYVINLQWTPKDSVAAIKINGKCDEVMQLVMKYMNINVPAYNRLRDPIFSHATLLAPQEFHTVSQPMLKMHTDALFAKQQCDKTEKMSADDDDDDDESCFDDTEHSKNSNLDDENVTSEENIQNKEESDDLNDEENECKSNFNEMTTKSKENTVKKWKNKDLGNIKLEVDIKEEENSIKNAFSDVGKMEEKVGDGSTTKTKEAKLGCVDWDDEKVNENIEVKPDLNKDTLFKTTKKILCETRYNECTNVFTSDIAAVELKNEVKLENNIKSETIFPNEIKSENCKNEQQLLQKVDSNNSQNSIPPKIDSNSEFQFDEKYNLKLLDEKSHTGQLKANNIPCNLMNLNTQQERRNKDITYYNQNNKISIEDHNAQESVATKESEEHPSSNRGNFKISKDSVDDITQAAAQEETAHTTITYENKAKNPATFCDNRNLRIPNSLASSSDEDLYISSSFPLSKNKQNSIKEKHNLKVMPNIPHIEKKDYYKNILNYGHHIPHWFDVNYAYSGLHSIIHPPPMEVDIWGTTIIPIFQLNRTDAQCEFCFDNYAEYTCQFYRPCVTDFSHTTNSGRVIFCECCDYSDDENQIMVDDVICTGNDVVSNKIQNCAKLEMKHEEKESIIKVQAGWYGKGYRKMFRRKKKY